MNKANEKAQYDAESKIIYEYSNDLNGYVIAAGKQYTCPSTFTIPLEYENKPVVGIKDSGFQNQTSIKELVISENIVSIGSKSFLGCTNVTKITIPYTGVTSNDENGFSSMFGGYANSVPASLKTIVCTSDTIKGHAFSDLKNITTFDVSKASTIGYGAFSGCENAGNFVFSSDLKSVDSHAFANTKLSKFSITSKTEYIGSAAFVNCYSLKTISIDPNNQFYTFENGTLYNKDKTNLVAHLCSDAQTTFEVPASVKKIEAQAFYGNKAISKLILNEGVIEIEDYAFEEMVSLTSCNIPSTVKKVGSRLFYHPLNKCNIKVVDYNGSEADFNKIEMGLNAFAGVTINFK